MRINRYYATSVTAYQKALVLDEKNADVKSALSVAEDALAVEKHNYAMRRSQLREQLKQSLHAWIEQNPFWANIFTKTLQVASRESDLNSLYLIYKEQSPFIAYIE